MFATIRAGATIAIFSGIIAACTSASEAQILTNPDGGASTAEAAVDAPGTTACLAAGGHCVPMAGSVCDAVGFQDCGPGARCCLSTVCQTGSGVHLIQASSYDQTCAVDTDCTAISEGSTCNACNFSCGNAAINVRGLAQYMKDTADLYPSAYELCPSSCGGPQSTCCRGGTCHWGYPNCPYPGQVVDASLDVGDASPE
jgi:hypothetical protein